MNIKVAVFTVSERLLIHIFVEDWERDGWTSQKQYYNSPSTFLKIGGINSSTYCYLISGNLPWQDVRELRHRLFLQQSFYQQYHVEMPPSVYLEDNIRPDFFISWFTNPPTALLRKGWLTKHGPSRTHGLVTDHHRTTDQSTKHGLKCKARSNGQIFMDWSDKRRTVTDGSVETPQTTPKHLQTTPNHIKTIPNHFLNAQNMFLW